MLTRCYGHFLTLGLQPEAHANHGTVSHLQSISAQPQDLSYTFVLRPHLFYGFFSPSPLGPLRGSFRKLCLQGSAIPLGYTRGPHPDVPSLEKNCRHRRLGNCGLSRAAGPWCLLVWPPGGALGLHVLGRSSRLLLQQECIKQV